MERDILDCSGLPMFVLYCELQNGIEVRESEVIRLEIHDTSLVVD